MASLGVDVVVEKLLRKSAREAISSSSVIFRNKHPQAFDHLYTIAGRKKVLRNYVAHRSKLNKLVNATDGGIATLFAKFAKLKHLNKSELIDLFKKRLNKYPALGEYNQAEFTTTVLNKGKKTEVIKEFSLSGDKNAILESFGNPPKLPENTVDVFLDYDDFLDFVEGAIDYEKRARRFDSEIKYIYNFLKNHLDKGDEFIIETSNIFKICGSCSREFLMLENYLKSIGKKVTLTVKSDSKIEGFSDLKDIPEIKKIKKETYKNYKKTKK